MLIYYISHPKVIVNSDLDDSKWQISEHGYKQVDLLLEKEWIEKIEKIFSSNEKKTLDTSRIQSEKLGIEHEVIKELGGVKRNRKKTGFLSKEDFQKAAEDFHRFPKKPVFDAWDTAESVQKRNVGAINKIVSENRVLKSIAIIGHGDAGTLLMCYFLNKPISKKYDQLQLGSYFIYDSEKKEIVQGWKPMD